MSIVFLLFIGLFFLIGLGIMGWGVYCYIKSQKAADWLLTEGTMNACKVEESKDTDGSTWRVIVGYSYHVSGRQLSGDRIAFGYSGSGNQREHAALYEKLSKARVVTVRYNPYDPSESVLTYGINRFTILMLVFGLTWLLFTAGFTALWTLSDKTDIKMFERIEIRE